jgi:hypothetical protein
LAVNARESSRYKRILRALNGRAGCRALKYHGGVYGHLGHPDIYGCDNGRSFFFEVKRPGETLTPRQAAELAAWAETGAITGVVESAEGAMEILDRAKGGPGKC